MPYDPGAGHGGVSDGPDPQGTALGHGPVVRAGAEGDVVDPAGSPVQLRPPLVAAGEPVVTAGVVVVVAAVQAAYGPPVP